MNHAIAEAHEPREKRVVRAGGEHVDGPEILQGRRPRRSAHQQIGIAMTLPETPDAKVDDGRSR